MHTVPSLHNGGGGWDGPLHLNYAEVPAYIRREAFFFFFSNYVHTLNCIYIFRVRVRTGLYVLFLLLCFFFQAVFYFFICFGQHHGVETVWVDYTSDGDASGDSLCWSREGGQAYCVSANDVSMYNKKCRKS